MSTLFNAQVRKVTNEATRKMADEGGRQIEHFVRINTPVESGELRSSWKRGEATPAVRSGQSGWKSTVSTDVSYAPFVEHGTGLWGPKHSKYMIKPKKPGGMLRFVVDGKVVFARFVMHPGSPGQFMMQIALNVTEGLAQEGAIFDGVLHEWVAEVEGLPH